LLGIPAIWPGPSWFALPKESAFTASRPIICLLIYDHAFAKHP
jgi:hypothetical protein